MKKTTGSDHTKAVAGLPDLLAPNLKVIFCGINPGLSAAAQGHHFLNRSNRFWRVLHLAGFTPAEISPEQDKDILRHGYGLTTAVSRPTSRADQLPPTAFATAASELAEKITRYTPQAVAFLGKRAYVAMYRVKSVEWGRQPEPITGVETWILPNPSGLNRSFRLADLVAAYMELRRSLT
jgi:TDG/mug DNA glycosylase family protein